MQDYQFSWIRPSKILRRNSDKAQWRKYTSIYSVIKKASSTKQLKIPLNLNEKEFQIK